MTGAELLALSEATVVTEVIDDEAPYITAMRQIVLLTGWDDSNEREMEKLAKILVDLVDEIIVAAHVGC